MKISMHTMSVDSFVPMLESLSAILDKGAAHAKTAKLDLVNARLAPDMYTLAQQVQIASRRRSPISRACQQQPSKVRRSATVPFPCRTIPPWPFG